MRFFLGHVLRLYVDKQDRYLAKVLARALSNANKHNSTIAAITTRSSSDDSLLVWFSTSRASLGLFILCVVLCCVGLGYPPSSPSPILPPSPSPSFSFSHLIWRRVTNPFLLLLLAKVRNNFASLTSLPRWFNSPSPPPNKPTRPPPPATNSPSHPPTSSSCPACHPRPRPRRRAARRCTPGSSPGTPGTARSRSR